VFKNGQEFGEDSILKAEIENGMTFRQICGWGREC
jgi:hypothetical protein